MKKQIKRLTPHQNGKVLGILMGVGTLPMFVLTVIPMLFMMPNVDPMGNPINTHFPFVMFLFMPIIYLVFTYISVALGCWLYNLFFKYIGGFELEFKEDD